jgi:tetratricopeptide (TPR) repeat protein
MNKNIRYYFLIGFFVFTALSVWAQDSGSAQKHYDRGVDYIKLGKYEEAVIELKEAVSLDTLGECGTGIKGEAYYKLGYALYIQFDFKDGKVDHSKDLESLPILRKAYSFNPTNPKPLNAIGVVYIVLQQKDSAEYYVKQVIEKFPNYAPAYYQMTRIRKDPKEEFKNLSLYFKYYDKNKDDDYGLMYTSAQLSYSILQRQLGVLTLKMFEDTIQSYYLRRSDSIVDYSIRVFNYPTTDTTNWTSSLKGFYGALLNENPEIKLEFEKRKNEIINKSIYTILDSILLQNFPEIESNQKRNPSLNDFYWGAFYATGKVKYIDKLLDNCVYSNEKEDVNLYLTGATAMWSLCSNSQDSPLVKNHLKLRKDEKNKYAKMILAKDAQYFYDKTKRDLKKMKNK